MDQAIHELLGMTSLSVKSRAAYLRSLPEPLRQAVVRHLRQAVVRHLRQGV
ncbi:MAG: hypothetical protein ACRDVM_03520 [Acidimicrobiia bacterium]